MRTRIRACSYVSCSRVWTTLWLIHIEHWSIVNTLKYRVISDLRRTFLG